MSLNRKESLKSLILLAFPIIMEEILSTLLQYVDTAMVGRLGAEATSSVSLTSTVNWLIYSLFSSFGIAVTAIISTALGADDRKKIKNTSSLAFTVSLLMGVVFAAIAVALSPCIPKWMNASPSIQSNASMYFAIISLAIPFRAVIIIGSSALRAVKDTKTPLYVSLSANLMNIVLNYLLIYTFSLGVKGAAAATLISYAAASIIMVIVWRRKELLAFKELKIEGRIMKEAWDISLPVALTNTTSCLGHIVFASLVSSMGTVLFAAHSIALSAETIFYVPGYGLRGATQTMIGISVGEKNKNLFIEIEKETMALTIIMMTITGTLLYFSAEAVMSFFSPDMTVIEEGTQILRLIAFTEPLFGIMIAAEGIYYGLGETKYPFIIETLGAWGIRILFSTILIKAFDATLSGVWMCMAADNTFRALGLAFPILCKRGTKLFEEKTLTLK